MILIKMLQTTLMILDEEVCVQLPTSADNATLLAFAAVRRAAVRRRLLQQSIDISCPPRRCRYGSRGGCYGTD